MGDAEFKPDFKETLPTEPIYQCVTPLFTVRNGREEFASGTAFLIGPGWAVTAYHVLDDFIKHYQGPPKTSGVIDISFQMLGYLSLDRGQRFLPLRFVRG